MRRRSTLCAFVLGLTSVVGSAPSASAFDLQITISNPVAFTPVQLAILEEAIPVAEAVWEEVVTGYQPGINIPVVPIRIIAVDTGLAAANFSTTTNQGGFRLSTSGFVNFNRNELETFAAWPRMDDGFGLNFVDDILAHEIGHALGIGTLWDDNNLYVNNSFQYTGAFGVAAFRDEFDPDATFIPVENAGGPGTMNSHWDQLMRSSTQEGNPDDPFSLSPKIGLVDALGRDLGLELMTGAIDPDFGEPFLSNTTIQSMRDLGFTVVPEPAAGVLLLLGTWLGVFRRPTA